MGNVNSGKSGNMQEKKQWNKNLSRTEMQKSKTVLVIFLLAAGGNVKVIDD